MFGTVYQLPLILFSQMFGTIYQLPLILFTTAVWDSVLATTDTVYIRCLECFSSYH